MNATARKMIRVGDGSLVEAGPTLRELFVEHAKTCPECGKPRRFKKRLRLLMRMQEEMRRECAANPLPEEIQEETEG